MLSYGDEMADMKRFLKRVGFSAIYSLVVCCLLFSVVPVSTLAMDTGDKGEMKRLAADPGPPIRHELWIKRAAAEAAEQLNRIEPLQSRKIQVSQNNFCDRDSKINLPFSAIWSEAMAAALSKLGVIVTTQEVGETPFRLVGTYAVEKTGAVITNRVRVMGESASVDRAVVETRLPADCLEEKWFRPQFTRVASTLVHMLEMNWTNGLVNARDIGVTPLLPEASGQAPLRLGEALGKYLADALSESVLHVKSGPPGSRAPIELKGGYALEEDQVRVNLRLVDQQQHILSHASCEIDISQIPSELMRMEPLTGSLKMGLLYKPGVAGISADSPSVESISNYLSEALSRYSIFLQKRSSSGDMVPRMEFSVRTGEKEMARGYRMASGVLSIDVINGDGRSCGHRSWHFKRLFKGRLDAAIDAEMKRLMERKRFAKELAAVVLSGENSGGYR
jgi:hypothetical protein